MIVEYEFFSLPILISLSPLSDFPLCVSYILSIQYLRCLSSCLLLVLEKQMVALSVTVIKGYSATLAKTEVVQPHKTQLKGNESAQTD